VTNSSVFELNLGFSNLMNSRKKSRKKSGNKITKRVRFLSQRRPEPGYTTGSELSGTAINDTGLFIGPVVPAQGSDYKTRVGNEIYVDSWEFKFSVEPSSSSVGPANVRIIIGYTKDAAAAITTARLLDVASPLGLYNRDYRLNIVALYDKSITVPAASTNYVPNTWSISVPFRVVWSWAADGTTSTHNQPFMFFISDLATTQPRLFYHHRLNYLP